MERLYLGVDGGGTKTHALIARESGEVIGFGKGGSSNIYEIPFEIGMGNVLGAITAAQTDAGVSDMPLAAATLSLSGADWADDFVEIEAWFQKRLSTDNLHVLNDAVGGLYAGLPEGPGVAVICGTATAIAARGPDGEIWHTSFWQLAGAGMDLAYKSLELVYRAEMGLIPPTTLTDQVLTHFDMESVEALLYAMTGRHGQRPKGYAELSRIILDAAESGDLPSRNAVTELGRANGDFANVAARKVGIAGVPYTVVLGGSVLGHESPVLGDAIVERICEESPDVGVVRLEHPPVVGALRHTFIVSDVDWRCIQSLPTGTLSR